MTTATPAKAKPAHKLRDGLLTVTIWKNTGDKGPRYSATPARSYKKDDTWNESDRFASDELLPLAKLLDEAHSWMRAAEQADRKADKAAALRRKHLAWMETLAPLRPKSDRSQIAGEALEMALEELHQALQQEFSADAPEPLSLDQAIAFLRRHTPPA
jgi:hypothetical protein